MSDKRADDPAMADILASIRKIVSDEDRGGASRRLFPAGEDDILVLTREMLIEEGAKQPERPAPGALFGAPPRPAQTFAPPPSASPFPATFASDHDAGSGPADAPAADGLIAPSALDLGADAGLDEAAVADIVRQVLREEFEGDFGRNLTKQIRRLVHAEVTRAMASPGGPDA